MSNSSLRLTTIKQGEYPLQVVNDKGIIHRLQPVKQLVQIELKDFPAGKVKTLNLDDYLDRDYLIEHLDFDLESDDSEQFENGVQRPRNEQPYVQIRVIKNGIQIKSYYYTVADRVVPYADIPINHNHQWQIKSSKALKSLTLYCIPIYLHKPIVIY